MDILLQNRHPGRTGNGVWQSLTFNTAHIAKGLLQEVKTGTGIAVSAVEHAVEQPIGMVRTLGTEIKNTVVETKNTIVHLAILGGLAFFAYEFVATQDVVGRTMGWVDGMVEGKRLRRY
jgi:hypothetical protein